MKRYALFGGETFYASGGINDYIHSFDTLDEATAVAEELTLQPELEYDVQWWHIVDLTTMEKVCEAEQTPYGQW